MSQENNCAIGCKRKAEILRAKLQAEKNGDGDVSKLDQTKDGHDSEDTKQSTADMTAFVQNLIQQMQSRFQAMSESIVSKIDEMGSRIDELEKSINDLRAEMGVEGSPSPLPPEKAKSEEPKPAEGST
ncbi:hypothetical protein AAC387_Pa09g0376 [Persea americana]